MANFTEPSGSTGTVSKILVATNPTNDTVLTPVFIANAGENPKYLGFLQNCTPAAPNGYIEVCKASCPTNPLTSNDPTNYYFTLQGSTFSSSPGLQVPLGECSGPIPISTSSGLATIMELPTPGVSACNVTAVGYTSAGLTDLLVPNTFNPTTGTAEIIVQAPPSTADMSLETIVTYYNQLAPPTELKLCKIAGNGITPGGTPFNLTEVNITNAGSGYPATPAPAVTITGGGCTTEPTATAIVSGGSVTGITLTSTGSGCSTSTPLVVTIGPPPASQPPGVTATATAAIVPVEAGPISEAGYCELVSGTFEVGTSGTVTENVPAGDGVPAVTVNGANATPSPCVFSSSGFPCSVATPIGAGVNEVSFTNCVAGPAPLPQVPCAPPSGSGDALPSLGIVNYSLVSQVASTGTQSYITYRADLLNTGKTILSPLVAMLSSLDPSSIQVVGQGELNFVSAPANSQVASSNTFTILTDPTVPLDFSKLSWEYYSRRSVPPRRR